MRVINWKQRSFNAELENLNTRPAFPPAIEDGVRKLLHQVRTEGDAAIVKLAKKFDGVRLTPDTFAVPAEDLAKAALRITPAARTAIKNALAHITAFARKRRPKDWTFSPRNGVILGEQFTPLDRVGVYVPGGEAPLVSTVLHTAGIAKAAGVKEIVLITPPGPDGSVDPHILYAARQAGVTEFYRLGGVYAVGALAYGTETIRKVEKIVGPGNAYVTAAKKLVYGEVALDLVAGPSEIMVLADDTADPAFVAADLLSQAEHGGGNQAVLVTTSSSLVAEVKKELKKQCAKLSRREIAEKVLKDGVFLIEAQNLKQAIEIAGNYAPEHLELMCRRATAVAREIKAAGAIFIGPWTPEPVGDFVAGPSHVLPTAGSARHFSGLTVEGFFRRSSLVNYRPGALDAELADIAEFAAMEGLDAHGNSAAIRMK